MQRNESNGSGRVTCVRNCAWLILWNANLNRHQFGTDQDLAFAGNTIIQAGGTYDGPVDREIDGRSLMVMPGLVNMHSHPSLEPTYKGIREEHGVPEMYMTGLYERSAVMMPDQEGQVAATEVAYCEMLLSGVTSVADLSFDCPGWVELAERSGMRVWLAPWYASARWYVDNRHEVKFRWDEKAGRAEFDRSLKLIQSVRRNPTGRLSGMLFPAQIDTCTEDLLRDSVVAAIELGAPLTTHAAQSVLEFNHMVQRYGRTPIQWASDIGLLGPNTTIGHAIFIDEHSWLHWYSRDDVGLLAQSGSTVAHCPTVFSRYGQMLEDFGRYKRAGVNMAIGTDTIPHNMIEEMRAAAIFSRVSAGNIFTASTEDILTAATVGGAKALLRDDIGSLAVGMKADIVLVDLSVPEMRPVRDPLRSLIYSAADRAVKDVFVDGLQVVADGKVLNLDFDDACDRTEQAQRRMMDKVPMLDYAKRTIDQLTPLCLSRIAYHS
jgi:5-methylthioadenosine/S-adenosylhomocysteine deaminase